MGKTGQRVQGGIAVLVLAGAGGAFYVYNHNPALKQELLQATGAVSKPIPKPPADAPVGFNASRTAFVLPHKLGYLPAPELALAKSDPAYAAGLANLKDWQRFVAAAKRQGRPNHIYWAYTSGLPTQHVGISPGAAKRTISGLIASPNNALVRDHVITTRVLIHDFTRHLLSFTNIPSAVIPEYVSPSMLEVQAAPVRTAIVRGIPRAIVCDPSPMAFLHNGHVFNSQKLPRITAGPSTLLTTDEVNIWIQGVASCQGFK
jgi:hypothetical protein